MKQTYVYQLVVDYPAEPNLTAWKANTFHYANEEPREFQWPRNRKFLSAAGADHLTRLYREYGAEVVVVRSEPVVFPDLEDLRRERDLKVISGLQALEISLR